MAIYFVERQYLLPMVQSLRIEADTIKEACAKAIEHDTWDGQREMGDESGATTISYVAEIPPTADPGDVDLMSENPWNAPAVWRRDVPPVFASEDGGGDADTTIATESRAPAS